MGGVEFGPPLQSLSCRIATSSEGTKINLRTNLGDTVSHPRRGYTAATSEARSSDVLPARPRPRGVARGMPPPRPAPPRSGVFDRVARPAPLSPADLGQAPSPADPRLLGWSRRAPALAVTIQLVELAFRGSPGCTKFGCTIFGCYNLAAPLSSRAGTFHFISVCFRYVLVVRNLLSVLL